MSEEMVRVQIIDKANCILIHANAHEKGLNQSVLSPNVDK